jgi:hypothetical protein
MRLSNVDIESAMRRVADRRIEEAMREGKFDNLTGKGQPLELEPMPADENARLTWWALKILRQNDVIPDEVRWRKTIDLLRERLHSCRTEETVRSLTAQINTLILKVNTLGTNVLTHPLAPLSEADELQFFRLRTAPSASA